MEKYEIKGETDKRGTQVQRWNAVTCSIPRPQRELTLYHTNIFLPFMALHANKMAYWEPKESKPGLMCIDPDLQPGERWVIAVFQDESSFHANEYKRTIWYIP